MSAFKEDYLTYLSNFGCHEKRSMFGGTGVFIHGAMYAILTDTTIFIRGGGELDDKLLQLGCLKFKHIKKSTTATVNYYDITKLFLRDKNKCHLLINESISFSQKEKAFKCSEESRRLRDLPNMRLTLERMVKKAGIPDVNSFLLLGAAEVFRKVRKTHGADIDLKLLWMFAGAVNGCHWSLLNDDHKEKLLNAIE
ncbi:DNA transformation protein [Photobacterium profundum]|nr:TfoX/Sxy family DNA transformation protein [Photobacterium profundum]PSV64310.1 DNA transformation protein [Photobacterium profundum]